MDIKDLFKDITEYEGKEVTLEGWVRNNRNQSDFGFIDFTIGIIQLSIIKGTNRHMACLYVVL